MSRTPSQQCGHSTPDRPGIEYRPYHHHPDTIPMTYQPYPYHEPRHVRPPEPGFARPDLSTAPGPRLPPLGRIMETNPDPRYRVYSDNSYANQQSHTQTLPLRMHHQSPVIADPRGDYTHYEARSSPMLSHDGELPSHRLRTYDLESQ